MSAEHENKGEWAETAEEGIAPAEDGGEDPQLGSAVTGRTTGSDEPATAEGVDLSAGDHADAVTDGGQEAPPGAEPDLRDAGAAARDAAKDDAA